MLDLIEIDYHLWVELSFWLGATLDVQAFRRILELHVLGTRADIFLGLGVLPLKVLQLSVQKLDVHNSARPRIDRALPFQPRRGHIFPQAATFDIGVLVLLVEWLAVLQGVLYLIDDL